MKAWKPRIKMEEGGGEVMERWRQVRGKVGREMGCVLIEVAFIDNAGCGSHGVSPLISPFKREAGSTE